jgi:hypothetical protein
MDVQASIKRLRDFLARPFGPTPDGAAAQRHQDIIDVCKAYEITKADATRYRQGLTVVMGEAAEAIIARNEERLKFENANCQVGRLARRVGELETRNIELSEKQSSVVRALEAAEIVLKTSCEAREMLMRQLDGATTRCQTLEQELCASRASKTALCGAHLDNVWCELPAGHDGAHWGAATKIWDQVPVKADSAQPAPPKRCPVTFGNVHCECDAGHAGRHYINTTGISGVCWEATTAPTPDEGSATGDYTPKVHELKRDTVTGWSSCAVCQMTTCNPAIHVNQPCPGVKR